MTSTTSVGPLTPSQRVRRAYRRILAAQRPEIWIHLRHERDVLADARVIERGLAAGEPLPLAGATVAVKDNIDVGGLPTTAGCPAFGYRADTDATAVARLKTAGAVVLGKTNMDQFATGLTGTRSPYGAVRDARRPEFVSGGSSSGSAVAVALGLADLGLATDTAGSGRVPAAFQGIVGMKPTVGLVPAAGTVPACRSFDCVSVFAQSVTEAQLAIGTMAGLDGQDPGSEPLLDAPLAAKSRRAIAIAARDALESLSRDARAALEATYTRCRRELGAELVEIDLDPFLAAGRLLYDGAFVAERYAAVGPFIDAHREAVDPHVAEIVLGGRSISGESQLADTGRLKDYRLAARRALEGCDALLLPTVPLQPTIAQVRADPIESNRTLGVYTTFCNLLDLCAVALPSGSAADGGSFGVTFFAPAFRDPALAELATQFDRRRGRRPVSPSLS